MAPGSVVDLDVDLIVTETDCYKCDICVTVLHWILLCVVAHENFTLEIYHHEQANMKKKKVFLNIYSSGCRSLQL